MSLSALFSPLRTVAGVELVWQGAGEWRASLCQLQRAGETVTITQQQTGLPDVAALAAALGPEPTPVALVLAGRGLLLRTMPTTKPDQQTLDAGQFAALLPGSNPDDFYCQCAVGPELTQVALVRRQAVEELIAAFHAAGLWVVDLSLGAFCLEGVLPYLTQRPPQSESVPAGPFYVTLTAASNRLLAFAAQPPAADELLDYKVGEEVVSSRDILPYAAALGALTGAAGPPLEVPAVRLLQREWQQRGLFQRLRLGVSLGILALLLANLLLGQYLQARQDQLTTNVGGNQQQLARVRVLQQAAQRQQGFLAATGWTQPSYNSLCADRLAASLPPGIQLLVADITPLQQGAGEPGHRLSFRADVVTVRGQCRNAQQFNGWLQQLTTLPWVKAVRDQNFAYDYSGGTGTFTFTLLLNPAALRT
jgi:Tfp pilus assembly protein PilN